MVMFGLPCSISVVTFNDVAWRGLEVGRQVPLHELTEVLRLLSLGAELDDDDRRFVGFEGGR